MIQSIFYDQMKSWGTGKTIKFCLGADVGGSGIRFRFSNANNQDQFFEPGHIKLSSARQFHNLFDKLSKEIKKNVPGATCVGSSIACAGLRKEDTVQVMNWKGSSEYQTIHISKINQQLFPYQHSLMMNDLEAGGYGIISLAKDKNRANKYFKKLWGPRGGSLLSSFYNTAIMAMGSGLGSALILAEHNTNTHVVIPTESGYLMSSSHLDKHIKYSDQIQTMNFVSDLYFDGQLNPPFEDLASGHGLVDDYKALMNNPKLKIDASKIAKKAKGGDSLAKTAMKNHYIYFTKLAKQFAYGLNCRSIVMALSNQVSNKWLIDEIQNELEAEFKDTPEWRTVDQVSVYSQVEDVNVNIVGTTYMAHYCSTHKL